MSFSKQFLLETQGIAAEIDPSILESLAAGVCTVRENQGRIFFLGVGGSAANASHAVNDFRKIAGIECYAPSDNVSELSARINDDGWDTSFSNWLKVSRLNSRDAVFVFSVGGGNEEKNVSTNIVNAVKFAKSVDAKVFGIVSRDGGYTAKVADVCVIIPVINPETTTAHAEAFQAVVWHSIISHPSVKISQTKWESVR